MYFHSDCRKGLMNDEYHYYLCHNYNYNRDYVDPVALNERVTARPSWIQVTAVTNTWRAGDNSPALDTGHTCTPCEQRYKYGITCSSKTLFYSRTWARATSRCPTSVMSRYCRHAACHQPCYSIVPDFTLNSGYTWILGYNNYMWRVIKVLCHY